MREREAERSRQRELLSCNQKAQKAKPKERTKNWSVALIKVSNKSKGATPTLQLMQYLAHCATLWQYYSRSRGWQGERGEGSFDTKNLAQSAHNFFFVFWAFCDAESALRNYEMQLFMLPRPLYRVVSYWNMIIALQYVSVVCVCAACCHVAMHFNQLYGVLGEEFRVTPSLVLPPAPPPLFIHTLFTGWAPQRLSVSALIFQFRKWLRQQSATSTLPQSLPC